MYLMRNENGDWIEISEGSKLFVLNTDGVDSQEYLKGEGLTLNDIRFATCYLGW